MRKGLEFYGDGTGWDGTWLLECRSSKLLSCSCSLQQGWNITVDLVICPKGIRQVTSKDAKVGIPGWESRGSRSGISD